MPYSDYHTLQLNRPEPGNLESVMGQPGRLTVAVAQGHRELTEIWREVDTDPDTRVKLFRRLALAYATHGGPLPYIYLNPGDVAHQTVYFRAVDTSTLSPLPGSGAKSNKILVSFVNFDRVSRRMMVRVTMPVNGTYEGEVFTSANTYVAARSTVSLSASPTLDFPVVLNPLE